MIEYYDFPSIKSHNISIASGLLSISSNLIFLLILFFTVYSKSQPITNLNVPSVISCILFNIIIIISPFLFILSTYMVCRSYYYFRHNSINRKQFITSILGFTLALIPFILFIINKQIFYATFGLEYYTCLR